MYVHERIKRYMEQHRISVTDTAQKAGLSAHVLTAMLSGEQTLYADDLRVICLALNVSPEAFVEE